MTTIQIAIVAVVALASPAMAAETGWVCHYEVPKDDFLKTLGANDPLEKFVRRGNELVVEDPVVGAIRGKDADELATRYRIIEDTSVGIVAAYGAAEKGDIYTETISIMRDGTGRATKTVISIKDPKANAILMGTCRSY